jgi:Fe-S oxidoreductase
LSTDRKKSDETAEEDNMFNEEKCRRCGVCLTLCPFIELPEDEAVAEIIQMVEKRESKVLAKNCAGCSYCDVVCPAKSNPSELRKEILVKKNRTKGVSCLSIISEQVPFNLMSIGLEFEKEEKLKKLDKNEKPFPLKEAFYLGCSLSYIYSDLANTKLLTGLPVIGGMKYCCGGYANNLFGREEAAFKGRQLLEEMKKIGVERIVTFCPGCDRMIGEVYPSILPEFGIKNINIVDYLLEQHGRGKIRFTQPINRKVTFHDSCAWRKMNPEIYENPRRLLQAMGAELVEMRHNRRESLCCGSPLSGRNPQLAARLAEKRVLEAKETGADTIVVSCTGCFALSGKAAEYGLEIFNITELAQMAAGEKPLHRIEEIKRELGKNIYKAIQENPEESAKRYILKEGEIRLI